MWWAQPRLPPDNLKTLPPQHQMCPVSKHCLKTGAWEANKCLRKITLQEAFEDRHKALFNQ